MDIHQNEGITKKLNPDPNAGIQSPKKAESIKNRGPPLAASLSPPHLHPTHFFGSRKFHFIVGEGEKNRVRKNGEVNDFLSLFGCADAGCPVVQEETSGGEKSLHDGPKGRSGHVRDEVRGGRHAHEERGHEERGRLQ